MSYKITPGNGDYKLSLDTKVHPHKDAYYEYAPLFFPSFNDMRLLILHPRSSTTSELELSITTVPLGVTGYCALSYTWGDASNQKEVRLNGYKFKVNENLFDALIGLEAHFDYPAPVWIDAICINQKDLDERAQQVKRMRDIFANAGFVIAWIGKPEEDDELGYELLKGIVERLDREPSTSSPIIKLPEHIAEWLMQGLQNPTFERMWNALSNILNRSWWKRAWIVQEIAVAKKSYMMCGDLLIDFTDVFKACTTIYMYEVVAMGGYGNASQQSELERGKAFMKFRNLGGGARNASLLSTEHAYQKYRTIIGSTASEAEFQEKSGLPIPTFFDLLWRFANKQSTDPRDKIYAYMGMAINPEETKRIEVDYNMSVSKLYRQVVRAHIEVRKNLKTFDWLGGVNRPEGFSSWAHGIASGTTPGADLFEVKELEIKWNAAFDTPARATFGGDEEEDLILQGILCDTVETVGDEFNEPHIIGTEQSSDEPGRKRAPNVYKAWQELAGIASFMKSVIDVKDDITRAGNPEQRMRDIVNTWINASHSSGSYPAGQGKLDAFIQTMVMDPIKTEEYSLAYLLRRILLVKNNRPNPMGLVMGATALLHRRFYITKKGYFGLGPKAITTGDKVCVLFGGATPYILRDQGDHHIVVGWSYIHGLMNGEATHKAKDREMKEEAFLIR